MFKPNTTLSIQIMQIIFTIDHNTTAFFVEYDQQK